MAWQQWCNGNGTLESPPIKSPTSNYFDTVSKRKRFSDLRYAMRMIEAEAIRPDCLIRRPKIEEANHIYNQCCSVIDIGATTANNRQRRTTQMKWTTVVKLMRIRNRRQSNNSP